MTTHIHIDRRLPDSQVYACSKRDAKGSLSALDGVEIHFGRLAHFEPDSRSAKRADLIGSVLAVANVTPEREAQIDFYPVAVSAFSKRESELFVETQLPVIAAWLRATLALPDTQLLAAQQLIIESVVDGFRKHELSHA